MGEILKGYNLGELGVNVTKSPIHLTDGELVSAQNGEFYVEEGLGALRKRPGLQKVHSSGLAGTVAGMIGVPLPDYTDRVIYRAAGGTMQLVSSLDYGVTNFQATPYGANGLGFNGFESLHADRNGNTYYVSPSARLNGFGNATADAFNPGKLIVVERTPPTSSGTVPGIGRISVLAQFADAGQTEFITTYKSYLYVSIRGAATFGHYGYQVNPETGPAVLLAPSGTVVAADEHIFSGCGWLGKFWIGTSRGIGSTTPGRIYWCRIPPSEQAVWILDHTNADNNRPTYTSLAVYRGDLYAASMSNLTPTAATIEKRTPGGTWSTSLTSVNTTGRNWFDGLYVWNDELYAFLHELAIPHVQICYKFNGTSWVQDEDLGALNVHYVRSVQAASTTKLFVSGTNSTFLITPLLKRTNAGVWSSVTTGWPEGALMIL